jgi:hypothetical protein
MSNTIFDKKCQSSTSKKLFGICDDQEFPDKPAYIDELNGSKWIAVVVNEDLFEVTFSAIDHCVELKRSDGKMEKSCDGVLIYESNVIFVELKDRNIYGTDWIKEAENQLKSTINFFEGTHQASDFKQKRAYIANKAKPKFRSSQFLRMQQFLNEMGYVLRIENRIVL